MIRRYSSDDIDRIFSDDNKYRCWLKIEILLLSYLSTKGVISQEEYERMKGELTVVPERVREMEKETRHDVVAFVNHISSMTGLEGRRWIHYGLTSSDLVDTGNSMMIREANGVFVERVYGLMKRLKSMAEDYREYYYPRRIRGSGIEGARSFGNECLKCYVDIRGALGELEKYRRHVECASISGSMGICSHIGTDLQDFMARELGLWSVECSTQVVSRDRYYVFFGMMRGIIGIIHRFCVELRLMARSEIGEVSERFFGGQMGSSSMPHKRNPITLENICGLCRMFDAYCSSLSKNVAIWFERDISHSSVDRIVFLDGFSLAVGIVDKFCEVLEGLEIDGERMKRNIRENEVEVYGRYIVEEAFRLREGKVGMEEIIGSIRRVEKEVKKGKMGLSEALGIDEFFGGFSGEEREKLMDISRHMGYLDEVYGRVLDERESWEVLVDEYELGKVVDGIVRELNGKFRDSSETVGMVVVRDDGIVCLAHVLTRLEFRVDVHSVGVDGLGDPVLEEFVRDREIILLGGKYVKGGVFGEVRKGIAKLGARGIFGVVVMVEKEDCLKGVVDLYGVALESLAGVVGFGVGDGEGRYSDVGFVGRLKG